MFFRAILFSTNQKTPLLLISPLHLHNKMFSFHNFLKRVESTSWYCLNPIRLLYRRQKGISRFCLFLKRLRSKLNCISRPFATGPLSMPCLLRMRESSAKYFSSILIPRFIFVWKCKKGADLRPWIQPVNQRPLAVSNLIVWVAPFFE